MAVLRDGHYFGKASLPEAYRTRELQAQAALRKLNARIGRVPNDNEHEGYYTFLEACRRDIVNVAGTPGDTEGGKS